MNGKPVLLVVFALYLPFYMFGAGTKTYRIGCNENHYPYIILDQATGEPEGAIIDWWRLWAKKTGAEVEFVPLDIEECITQTVEGEIDAIAGLFYSSERGEVLDFTDPLIRMQTVLFLKKNLHPESLEQFRGTIGILKDELAYAYLKEKYPGLKLKVFNDYLVLKANVRLKEIDGFVHDVPDPLGNFRQNPPPKGYYRYETLYAEKLRSAVRSGNSEMLNLVVAGSAAMTDEELYRIAARWNLFKAGPGRVTWTLVVFLLTGILAAAFFIFVLKRKRKGKEVDDFVAKTDWQELIDKGENDFVEFKSSLSWDFRLKRPNKILERAVAKTISAFLNTEGGLLLIGVNDNGKVLGLQPDYDCLKKQNRDGFLLALTNIINIHLGKSNHKFISINIFPYKGKDLCLVKVNASDKPVFMGKNDNEEFYIRASASSQPLGVRETYKYINSKWKRTGV